MFSTYAIAVICLVAPVNGEVVADYSPSGGYAGHWGIDYAAEVGDAVRAPSSGTVTFAGSVAGMKTVTIEPLPGLKVSVSYLREVGVTRGDRVRRGQVVGRAGTERGVPGVHMSLRLGGSYVDPSLGLGCRSTDISRGLRLIEPPPPYPRRRANRNSRRDLRPDSHRASSRR